MHLLHVVGTRPNLVKMAPVIAALRERFPDWPATVVHTGQHYDPEMSQIFLDELGIGEPDYMLGVGSGTHAEQVGRVLERIERIMLVERADLVLVPGDVNSTLAAALAAAKLEIPVAHVESGLRSFDRSMPEELNRVLVDHLADLLFLHCDDAVENLTREGIDAERMQFVGNTMIDTLVALEERFRARDAAAGLGLEQGSYLLVTLHRPALVDGALLGEAMAALASVAAEMPVVFPIHPRTRKMLGDAEPPGVRLLDPIGYLDFLSLEADAAGVLTDSGGIQEETTYLGVPCFTLRDNTERPVTVERGTNTLLGLEPGRIAEIPGLLADRAGDHLQPPPKWDGNAAQRIADVLADW
jgi:UDP-N-acetylglucosamine 2-epimerase (non-hydrolysing)